MKNKGIPFIEQHIEKFVLGAAGAVFFSVIAWQVLGTHNNVKLDGRDAAPSEIDEALATRTQALAQKLEQPAPAIDEKLGDRLKPQASSYASALGGKVAPQTDLPRIEAALASVLQSEGATVGQPFHDPRFPALAMRPTLQVSDTIEASVLEQQPDLKKRFSSSSGPFDINWTIPSAVIDAKSLRDELASSARGAQIPGFWYRSTLFVIDIEFERERKLDNGSWGEPTMVQPLPGQFSFRPELAKGADAGLRDSAFNYLTEKANQRQLLQPDFYATKRGNFSPALLLSEGSSEGDARSDDPEKAKLDDEIRRLKKELNKRSIDAKRIKEELESIGGPLEDTSKEDKKREEERKKDEERDRGGGGGSGGGLGRPGGGLGGGLGGGMSGGKNNPGESANKERRIKLTKTLKDLEKRVASAEESLAKKLEAAGMSSSALKAPQAASSDVTTADQLVVWAHDIGVSAGEQYRYRAVAKVYNPFFTNSALLVDSQKKLGDPFTLATAASDWSEAFRVSPPIAFFVVDAQAGEGRLGTGQATVEVFRYYDGERRRERFTIQPGDSIGGGRTRDGVEFDTGYFLVDVYADPSIERGGTDRRPGAVAVVQNALGDRYEIRIPKDELGHPLRLDFEDEIELAKADADAKKGGEKDAGKTDAPKGDAPKGPSGSGSGGGRDGDPKYGPQ